MHQKKLLKVIKILINLEQIREQKRAIDRSARNIEREKKKTEGDEKKMMAEIKKMAKNGQHVN